MNQSTSSSTGSDVGKQSVSTAPGRSKGNAISKALGKASALLGFKKKYNIILWFSFSCAMIGFVLARLSYIKVTKDNVPPGQWYWYHRNFYKIGLTLHLAAILPAGFLSVLQFIPRIRYAYLMAHRINGYIIYLLLILGVLGASMLTRRTLGGSFGAQIANVSLCIMTITSAALAYYNIRRLQVDQHRKWMLRTIFYMSSIITDRVLNIALTDILFKYLKYGAYYTVWDCQELKFTLDQFGLPEQYYAAFYPTCLPPNGTTPEETALLALSHTGYVAVKAAVGGTSGPEMYGSVYRWSFSGTLWWGLLIHAVGVEIYIRLTPGEDNRLREYSYQRQLEAGNTRYPGNAGTTRDRLGDAGDYPFEPKSHIGLSAVAVEPTSVENTII